MRLPMIAGGLIDVDPANIRSVIAYPGHGASPASRAMGSTDWDVRHARSADYAQMLAVTLILMDGSAVDVLLDRPAPQTVPLWGAWIELDCDLGRGRAREWTRPPPAWAVGPDGTESLLDGARVLGHIPPASELG